MASPDAKTVTDKPLVTATGAAIEELHKLMARESGEVDGVRLGVKGRGCSGLSYMLEFSKAREGDLAVE